MLFLQPIIEQTFGGLIWRIEIDAASLLLFVETRNVTDRLALFSSVDLDKDKINFLDLEQPEKWLVGLSGGRENMLFLYGYSSAQSPEHKGIISLNAFTGEQIWADYNLTLNRFAQNGLLVTDARLPNQKPKLLDYKTGSVIYAGVIEEDAIALHLPEIVAADLPVAIASQLNGIVTGEVVRLNYNSFIIISLHSQTNEQLQQHIFVLQNQALVYQDLLNENIQKLQPEAFMMANSYLIYIKNKITLKILNLNTGI